MKKGFTLIELLSIIVILAIIALIAIPSISKVVEQARIGAIRNSVYGMIDAAELAYATDDSDARECFISGFLSSLAFMIYGSSVFLHSGQP